MLNLYFPPVLQKLLNKTTSNDHTFVHLSTEFIAAMLYILIRRTPNK